MWEIIAIMVVGGAIGYAIRNKKNAAKYSEKACSYVIFVLLFSLGLLVGKNDTVMNNLSELGILSVIIAAAAIIGSVVCAWVLYKFYFKKIKNDEIKTNK